LNKSKGYLKDFIDIKLFLLIIDGIFTNWRGDYNVLLAENNQYLPVSKGEKSAQLLYAELRNTRTGKYELDASDRRFADLAFKEKKPITYFDYIGLVSTATPIFLGSTELATVFWFGVLPKDENQQDAFRKKVQDLEDSLGLAHKKLTELAQKISPVSDELLNEISLRLESLVESISNTGLDREELSQLRQNKNKYLALSERLIKTNSLFRNATTRINHFIAEKLNSKTLTDNDYWNEISAIFEETANVVGALYILMLIPVLSVTKQYRVKSTAKIPLSVFKSPYSLPEIFSNSIDREFPYRRNFDSLAGELRKFNRVLEDQIDKGLVIAVPMDVENTGFLIAFFDRRHRTEKAFENEEEKSILEFLGTIVSSSFQAWSANEAINKEFERREKETTEKLIWMEKITHQLMAPFNGLQGSAGLLMMMYEKWRNEQPHMFNNWSEGEKQSFRDGLNNIIWTTNSAALIIDNIMWRVGKKASVSTPEHIDDVARWLIEIVRDYQGIAYLRNIKISVDEKECRSLNSRIKVDQDFRQAIGNIIDNAVKYSKKDTTITIKAYENNNECVIEIVNIGIQLDKLEVTKIFQHGYRAQEAINKNAPGTGMGLSVAQEIVRQNHGKIKAYPSEQRGVAWQTVFAITLPLQQQGK